MNKFLPVLVAISFSGSLMAMHQTKELFMQKQIYTPKNISIESSSLSSTSYDSSSLAYHIKNMLDPISLEITEEKISEIKELLEDDSLSSQFCEQVKKHLVKHLAGQVFKYENIRRSQSEAPCQRTTHFDGLQEECFFIGEGGSYSTLVYDPKNSPWHKLTLPGLIRIYAKVATLKRAGRAYPIEHRRTAC